jgi:hypothetical protein
LQRFEPLVSRNVNLDIEGSVVDLRQVLNAESLLCYATVDGSARGWDVRTHAEPFCIRNPPTLGLTTSMLVDPAGNWLLIGAMSIREKPVMAPE